jgi:hypothetical protein
MPRHLILLNLIILIIIGKEYESQSSLLCSFLYPPVTSPSSSAPWSQTLSDYVPPLLSEISFTPIQNHQQNYSLVYSNFYAFELRMRRRKVLDRMVASITKIQSTPESNFDLLQLFPNIWTVIHFQMICFLFLCHNFELHSGDEQATCT